MRSCPPPAGALLTMYIVPSESRMRVPGGWGRPCEIPLCGTAPGAQFSQGEGEVGGVPAGVPGDAPPPPGGEGVVGGGGGVGVGGGGGGAGGAETPETRG